MLEEAYSFGLTPKEATELTLAEMASFILARRKKEQWMLKQLARIGYSAGILGSTALVKNKPKFEDVFKFPPDEEEAQANIERLKSRMLVWAENANRQSRNERR